MNQKKLFRSGLILTLMLVIIMGSIGAYAAGDNIEITVIESPTEVIQSGDIFTYTINIKNNSGNTLTVADTTIEVSGGFTLVGTNVTLDDAIDTNTNANKVLTLKYNGGSNKLNVSIYDTGGNVGILNRTIDKAYTTSTTPSTPTDTSKYMPEFDLKMNSTLKFLAGKSTTIDFTVENTTTYSSKNVRVQLLNDNQGSFPFDDMTNDIVSKVKALGPKKNDKFQLVVDTKSNAKSGFYTVPVKIIFENVYGKESSITKNIRIEVVNSNILPTVVIGEIKMITPSLVPGVDNQIVIDLKNLGSIDVKNLTATLEGTNINGVTLRADSAKKTVSEISANGKDFVMYNVSVSENIESSKHEMSLKLTYFDEYGDSYEETLPLYLDVNGSSNNIYDIDVQVTSLPSRVSSGSEFTVKFDVTNNGLGAYKNLKLSISSDGNFIYKTQPIIKLDSLAANEKKSFSYTMIAEKTMATNNYPTYIRVEKSDGSSSDAIIEYLGVYVDGEGDNAAMSKPKVIIDSYDFGGDFVLAGQEFDLAITFFNTSNTMGIQNAKVSISVSDGAFVPVDAASSFYVDSIPVKEKVTKVIRLKAKTDLQVKTYDVVVKIEYEDSKGNSYDINKNPYEATETMTIPGMQEIRLEIEEPRFGDMIYAFQPTELDVSFYNMGRSSLSNLLVRAEGDFEIIDGKSFVGEFAPGKSDYFMCDVIPMVAGTNTGKLIFEFEDAYGTKQTIEKEFTFEAYEMEVSEGGDMNGDFGGGDPGLDMGGEYNGQMGEEMFPEEAKSEFPLVIVLVASSVLILVIAIVVIRRKKKLRLIEEMEADD